MDHGCAALRCVGRADAARAQTGSQQPAVGLPPDLRRPRREQGRRVREEAVESSRVEPEQGRWAGTPTSCQVGHPTHDQAARQGFATPHWPPTAVRACVRTCVVLVPVPVLVLVLVRVESSRHPASPSVPPRLRPFWLECQPPYSWARYGPSSTCCSAASAACQPSPGRRARPPSTRPGVYFQAHARVCPLSRLVRKITSTRPSCAFHSSRRLHSSPQLIIHEHPHPPPLCCFFPTPS